LDYFTNNCSDFFRLYQFNNKASLGKLLALLAVYLLALFYFIAILAISNLSRVKKGDIFKYNIKEYTLYSLAIRELSLAILYSFTTKLNSILGAYFLLYIYKVRSS
jgi:hypothetical protein